MISVKRYFTDESGSPGLEYALILGLVGGAVFLAMSNLASSTSSLMQTLTQKIGQMAAELGS